MMLIPRLVAIDIIPMDRHERRAANVDPETAIAVDDVVGDRDAVGVVLVRMPDPDPGPPAAPRTSNPEMVTSWFALNLTMSARTPSPASTGRALPAMPVKTMGAPLVPRAVHREAAVRAGMHVDGRARGDRVGGLLERAPGG